jgi:hypothetical protein
MCTGLTLLASLTGGDLDVTTNGDIIYTFAKDFRSRLVSKSLGQKIKQIYQIIQPILYYLLRISFGIVLLTSLAIITSTFILVSSSSSSSDDDNRRSSRNSRVDFFGRNFFQPNLFDFLYYRPSLYYSSSRSNRGPSGFLESFFSYIFGDGNPNENIETEQVSVSYCIESIFSSTVCSLYSQYIAYILSAILKRDYKLYYISLYSYLPYDYPQLIYYV